MIVLSSNHHEANPKKKGRLATPYTKNRSGFLSFFSTLAPMRLAKETRTAFFIAVAVEIMGPEFKSRFELFHTKFPITFFVLYLLKP